MPYESVLEVTSENVSVENVKFTRDASKSVANNFGAFVKEGGSLMLNNVSITSETGSGLATEGGSIDAENVKIYKCKNHGVSALWESTGRAEERTSDARKRSDIELRWRWNLITRWRRSGFARCQNR